MIPRESIRVVDVQLRCFFLFFLSSQVLYPVGPGPSPARIARSLVPTGMWAKLAMSIAVDAIGCTSYAVPVRLGAQHGGFFFFFLPCFSSTVQYENPTLQYENLNRRHHAWFSVFLVGWPP